MPAPWQSREDPRQLVGVRLVRRLRGIASLHPPEQDQAGPKRGRRLHADTFCDRDEYLGG